MIKVHGLVRLTHDVELKEVGNTKVASLQIVYNGSKKKGEEYVPVAHFFNAVLWDTGAERLASTAKKGDLLFILDGELQDERWEKNGEKKERVVIRINKFYVPKPSNE